MSDRDMDAPADGDPAADDKAAKARAAAEAKARRAAEEAAKPAWERDAKPPERQEAADDPLVANLRAAHGSAIVSAYRAAGDLTLDVAAEMIQEVCRTLHDEHAFELLVDVCGVDYPQREDARFEIVYHLGSLAEERYVRIRTRVAEGDEVPTVSGIWRGANWCEREVYDMYGVRFSGHSDMTRILLWEGFNGYPLRKDFPVEGVDTGAAIYPERYEAGAGPVEGTGTGWKLSVDGSEPGEQESD